MRWLAVAAGWRDSACLSLFQAERSGLGAGVCERMPLATTRLCETMCVWRPVVHRSHILSVARALCSWVAAPKGLRASLRVVRAPELDGVLVCRAPAPGSTRRLPGRVSVLAAPAPCCCDYGGECVLVRVLCAVLTCMRHVLSGEALCATCCPLFSHSHPHPPTSTVYVGVDAHATQPVVYISHRNDAASLFCSQHSIQSLCRTRV